jgi:hypothetical protein
MLPESTVVADQTTGIGLHSVHALDGIAVELFSAPAMDRDKRSRLSANDLNSHDHVGCLQRS